MGQTIVFCRLSFSRYAGIFERMAHEAMPHPAGFVARFARYTGGEAALCYQYTLVS
ncbi:hypothetical protein SBA3_940005 [Candidatus Sulfopaludibacter sp. SbA3]|nr:hypothetical protein SBA3_940005 [Candidatus Sulfopaludibacter sp. SbA3]